MDFYQTFFTWTGYLALLGWILLVLTLFVPGTRPRLWPVTQFLLPALLCLCYLWMVWDGRAYLNFLDFFAISGVRELYSNDNALTAGWLHFLALDLFVGSWMVRDGLERGMNRLLILVCLPFTLMLGPSGLLLYLILRFVIPRRDPAAA